MTSIAEIISEAMIYIDDVRLQEQLSTNPALFYRRTSAYVSAAMPLLSSPPELLSHIERNYKAPEYDDFTWVSTDESTMDAETEVATGCIGYDLCSVISYSEDGTYTEAYTDATYDAETGIVTFPTQETSGIEYEIDFYKDGEVSDLTVTMKRLFALAIAIVWDERFSNTWLNLQPKIQDSSFHTVNESTYMDKLTQRMVAKRQAFQDELRKYEQTTAYANIPFGTTGRRKLV